MQMCALHKTGCACWQLLLPDSCHCGASPLEETVKLLWNTVWAKVFIKIIKLIHSMWNCSYSKIQLDHLNDSLSLMLLAWDNYEKLHIICRIHKFIAHVKNETYFNVCTILYFIKILLISVDLGKDMRGQV